MPDGYEHLNSSSRLICNFREIGHILYHMSESKGSQKRILLILMKTGTISQSALTQRLDVQPGSASEVIGKLEAAGLITRTPSAADRRTLDITLTAAGRTQAEEIAAQRKQRHDEMFSFLSEEEKETLLSLLERVNREWKTRYPRRK